MKRRGGMGASIGHWDKHWDGFCFSIEIFGTMAEQSTFSPFIASIGSLILYFWYPAI